MDTLPEKKQIFLKNIEHNNEYFVEHAKILQKEIETLLAPFNNVFDDITYEEAYQQAYEIALENLIEDETITASLGELYKQVSPLELVEECRFFLSDDCLKEREELFNDLAGKGKIRCHKENPDYTFPRTFTLTLANDGSIDMYLETKSKKPAVPGSPAKKLPPDEQETLKKMGVSKTGKPCWKLSEDPPKQYFSLVYNKHLESLLDVHPFEQETYYAALFGKQYVDCLEGGTVYVTKYGTIKAVSYTPAAISSLDQFISETGLINADGNEASEDEKYQLIEDMLLGIRAIHDKDYVHQDLKPANTLIYKTRDASGKTGLQAKISDFGVTTRIENPTRQPSGTMPYMSPEMWSFKISNNAMCKKHFNEREYFIYGTEIVATQLEKDLKDREGTANDKEALIQLRAEQNKHPSKHNDMWSIGMVAYEILYGPPPLMSASEDDIDSPEAIEKQKAIEQFHKNITNPLLSGLLDIDVKNRLSADEALILVQTTLKPKATTMEKTQQHTFQYDSISKELHPSLSELPSRSEQEQTRKPKAT